MDNPQYPEHEQWREDAACAGLSRESYDLFFPALPGRGNLPYQEAARVLCAGCSVRQECGEYAIANNIQFGMWGGMTQTERGRSNSGKLSLRLSDEYAGTSDEPTRQDRCRPVPPEFDLWQYSFTKDEQEATVAARRRRTEILARVDAELAELDALEASA